MAIDGSDFEAIRERHNQVYAIKRELIIFSIHKANSHERGTIPSF